jgi:SAM-dependent methyltransferase
MTDDSGPVPMKNRESSEWAEQLFIKNANLFVVAFRSQKGTEQEVEGLAKIFTEFNVPRKGRILDLPCGVGRHAIRLAGRGYYVTGVDFSPVFIRRARSDAVRRHVAKHTKFITGDLRNVQEVLSGTQPFDAIVSLWSSVGYYGKEEDLRMFKALRTIARPNCLLVVDNVNRDFLVLHPRETSVSDLGKFELHERPRLNLETSTMENVWEFYEKRGRDLKFRAKLPFSLRCYSLHELKELLEDAGWRYSKCYGNFSLQPFGRESNRIIACCRKR